MAAAPHEPAREPSAAPAAVASAAGAAGVAAASTWRDRPGSFANAFATGMFKHTWVPTDATKVLWAKREANGAPRAAALLLLPLPHSRPRCAPRVLPCQLPATLPPSWTRWDAACWKQCQVRALRTRLGLPCRHAVPLTRLRVCVCVGACLAAAPGPAGAAAVPDPTTLALATTYLTHRSSMSLADGKDMMELAHKLKCIGTPAGQRPPKAPATFRAHVDKVRDALYKAVSAAGAARRCARPDRVSPRACGADRRHDGAEARAP